MIDLISIEIGTIGVTITGKTPSSKFPEDFGSEYMFITPSDNFDDKTIYETKRYLSLKGLDKLKKKTLPPKSILVSCIGSAMGKVSMNHTTAITNQQINSIVVNPEFDPDYIYYQLKNSYKLLRNAALGSTALPMLNKTEFDKLKILIHGGLLIQKAIAKVLSDLDTKIELNNKINTELEAMAKLIYDYWFVQFDFPCLPENYKFSGASKPKDFNSILTYTQVGGLPVPDGKKWFVYVIECTDGSFYKGMTNDLYRRYYEHKTGQGAEWTITHKPKRIIHYETFSSQKEVAKREKELKTGYGRTWLKREYEKFIKYGYVPKSGLPAHQTRLMMAGKMVFNEELKREIPEGWEVKSLGDCATIKKGKLITAKTADSTGKIKVVSAGIDFSYFHSESNYKENTITVSASGASAGFINFWREPIFACDCTAVRGTNIEDTLLILEFLKMRQTYIYQQARGSAQPHVYPKDIEGLKISIPPNSLLKQYGDLVLAGNSKITNNIKENQNLTEIRDWLLPMLMNGQVTVGNTKIK